MARLPLPPRSPRRAALTCEALEGRALLATTALDPGFGTGGVVRGPLAYVNGGGSTPQTNLVAVAVQNDGKIVTAEILGSDNDSESPTPLVIRRFDANGSVDTTFGTAGETAIPFAGKGYFAGSHPALVLSASGQILVAGEATVEGGTSSAPTFSLEDVVARLTTTGALDTTFGTGGVVVLPMSEINTVNSIAVESSGRVVVAGLTPTTTTSQAPLVEAELIGLTATGAIDSTFGTNGQVVVPLAAPLPQNSTIPGVSVFGLHVAPTGQLLLGVNDQEYSTSIIGPIPTVEQFTISRVTADGVIDTNFGGGTGTVNLGSTFSAATFVVQPDGRIVLGGETTRGTGLAGHGAALARLNADGSVDSTFATPAINPLAASDSFTAIAVGTDGSITALVSSNLIATVPGSVFRFNADGTTDVSFGRGGRIGFALQPTSASGQFNTALALTPTGNVLVGGGLSNVAVPANPIQSVGQTFLAQLLPITLSSAINDYDGDGKSDIAAELTAFGAFAIRSSGGKADSVTSFGLPGAGEVLPAPGDYDGDGKTDIAAYLPQFGAFVYRPSSGGSDVVVQFGPAGLGNAIPAPGDYDGDGRTDVALFLPGTGTFAIDPSDGAAPYAVQFGAPGTNQTIPMPGDYDGDGKTDLAVYIPALGEFFYQPTNLAVQNNPFAAKAIVFGSAGIGASIPAPGDYDGNGSTDLALYIPASGALAVYPFGTGAGVPYAVPFGAAGSGLSVPVPGDYDGDGKTDVAVYLPTLGEFAYRPSSGGADSVQQFGAAGAGQTVPATVVVMPSTANISAMALEDFAAAPTAAYIPIPDDLVSDLNPTTRKRHS